MIRRAAVLGLAAAILSGCSSGETRPRDARLAWDSANAMPAAPRWSRGIFGEVHPVVDSSGTVQDSLAGQFWTSAPGDIKDPEFQSAFLATLKSWRYEPTRRDGENVTDTLTLVLAAEGDADLTRSKLAWDYRSGDRADTLWARWSADASATSPTPDEELAARREAIAQLLKDGVVPRRDRLCLLPLTQDGEVESAQVARLARDAGLASPLTGGCFEGPAKLLLMGRPFALGPGRFRIRVALEPTEPAGNVPNVLRQDCEVHLGAQNETRCVEYKGVGIRPINRYGLATYVKANPGAW